MASAKTSQAELGQAELGQAELGQPEPALDQAATVVPGQTADPAQTVEPSQLAEPSQAVEASQIEPVSATELNAWRRGFTPQAEIWNGRLAMLGLSLGLAVLLIARLSFS